MTENREAQHVRKAVHRALADVLGEQAWSPVSQRWVSVELIARHVVDRASAAAKIPGRP